VADAASGPGPLRIRAPRGLLLTRLLDARCQPALRVFDDDLPDLAQLPRPHHLARFFDERIAGVVVRQSVKQARSADDLPELPGLSEIEGRGFVGEHVEAIL